MLNNKQSTQLSLKQRLFAIGGVLVLIAAFAVLYTVQFNSLENLHAEPVCVGCSSDYIKYQLDWDDSSYWTEGSIDKAISDVDGSGTEFKIKYNGKYNKLARLGTGQTPNIQTFFSGGDHNALSHYVNPGLSADENIKITIQINPAIPAQLGFEIYHVNGDWYSGDRVQVYAETELDGNKIYPSFTATDNPSWQELGDGTIDAILPGESWADVAAGVNFSSTEMINKIVVEWSNCQICGTGVHGIGIGNISFFSNSHSLPVEWASFGASWEGQDAQVEWATAQELNTDYFIVERSIDGSQFEELGEVSAAGNSSDIRSYSFRDQRAKFASSQTLFYRLQQMDIDGAFSYSEVVELNANTDIPFELVVFPNPASDRLNLRMAGAMDENYQYKILNSQGQSLRSGQSTQTEELSLDVSALPPGTYQILVMGNTQQKAKSFIIAR